MRLIALAVALLALAVFVVGWRATEHHDTITPATCTTGYGC